MTELITHPLVFVPVALLTASVLVLGTVVIVAQLILSFRD